MSFAKVLQNGRRGSERSPLLLGALALGLTVFLITVSTDSREPDGGSTAEAKSAKPATATVEPVTSAVAEAETPPKPTGARRRPTPPQRPELVSPGRLLASLGALILFLVPGLMLARRYLKRVRVAPRGERVLELLDAMPLGPKRQIYVIAAWDRRLVIAATGDRIELLTELEDAPAAAPTPAPKTTRAAFDERMEPLLEMEARVG